MAQANEQQHQPTSACPCTHAHAQVLPRRSIGYDEQFSSQCIVRTRATRSSTNCTRSLAITVLRAPCRNPASRHSRCSAKASASGLAGAGQNPLAHQRPATSQHRVGRGAGEAAAHLACESVLEGFRQRKLRCRYFATRGWGLLSSPGRGSACRNSAQTCGPSFAARSRREIDGQLANSRLAVKLQATISRDK